MTTTYTGPESGKMTFEMPNKYEIDHNGYDILLCASDHTLVIKGGYIDLKFQIGSEIEYFVGGLEDESQTEVDQDRVNDLVRDRLHDYAMENISKAVREEA